jgi:hypothetical protein
MEAIRMQAASFGAVSASLGQFLEKIPSLAEVLP